MCGWVCGWGRGGVEARGLTVLTFAAGERMRGKLSSASWKIISPSVWERVKEESELE